MISLMVPDWAQLLRDVTEAGVSRKTIAARLRLVEMSPELLRHYERGGQPTYSRGVAIVAMWCEATGKSEVEVPLVRHRDSFRAEGAATMTLHKRCPTCSQKLRGQLLERWEQLQLHYEGYGSPTTYPSWLDPKTKLRESLQAAAAPRRKKEETA